MTVASEDKLDFAKHLFSVSLDSNKRRMSSKLCSVGCPTKSIRGGKSGDDWLVVSINASVDPRI